jgi:hypothetical protein
VVVEEEVVVPVMVAMGLAQAMDPGMVVATDRSVHASFIKQAFELIPIYQYMIYASAYIRVSNVY